MADARTAFRPRLPRARKPGTMVAAGPAAFVPYEGASTERARNGWNPTLGSADATLIPFLPLLRARSRDATRNGLGAGVIRTLVDYICGHRGLVRQAHIDPELFGGDEERARIAARQLEAAHRRRTRRVDIGGRHSWASMQRLLCRSWLVDGDALANLVLGPDGRLLIEAIDADRLSNPIGREGDERMRAGVEVDAAGVPVAYHITVAHPSDLHQRRRPEHRRVPRWNALGRPNVLHLYEELRAGQSRGEPVATAVLDKLDDWLEFEKCKLYQARTDAMVSYWIQREAGLETDTLEQDENGTPIEEVEYGANYYLRPGESITTPESARPGAELENFRTAIHSDIAAALGLTVELVAKDFTQTTWHSARQSSLEVMRTARSAQQTLLDQLVQPYDDIQCEDAILAGEVEEIPPDLYWSDPDGFLACTYQLPVRGLVDPSQENAASEQAITLNLSTLADECAARGKDWQEVIDQRAREIAYATEKLAALMPAAPGEDEQDSDADPDEQDGDEAPAEDTPADEPAEEETEE